MDPSFVEGALCTSQPSRGGLIYLIRRSVVSHDEDISPFTVNCSKEAANFTIKRLQHSNIQIPVADPSGGKPSLWCELSRRVMERIVRRVKSHPDNPWRGPSSLDKGDRLIDLDRCCIGRSIDALSHKTCN